MHIKLLYAHYNAGVCRILKYSITRIQNRSRVVLGKSEKLVRKTRHVRPYECALCMFDFFQELLPC